VLAASMAGVDDAALATLIATRKDRPFSSVADFRNRLPPSVILGNESGYAVSSAYFLVSVHAQQGDTQARARALLKRGQGSWPVVVWQVVE